MAHVARAVASVVVGHRRRYYVALCDRGLRASRWRTLGAVAAVARAALATTLALFLWIVVAPAARVRAHGDGRLHLTMIDVGQGDAMLVTFPNGRTLLVDTGGVTARATSTSAIASSVPRSARAALLGARLSRRHPRRSRSPRRRAGAGARFRAAGDLVGRAGAAPRADARACAPRPIAQRAAWRTLQRGDRFDIGGVELRVHHPPPPDWERQRVRNNDSLVIELRFGDVSMLLTGDIGREVEQELLPRLDLLPDRRPQSCRTTAARTSSSGGLRRAACTPPSR